MIPHRTPSISDASTSSAQETSQTGRTRQLLPAVRPQQAESSTHYQTAPLARKRAPIALACESCRQKKVKVGVDSNTCFVWQLIGLYSVTELDRYALNAGHGKPSVFTERRQIQTIVISTRHFWNHTLQQLCIELFNHDQEMKGSKSYDGFKLVSMLKL